MAGAKPVKYFLREQQLEVARRSIVVGERVRAAPPPQYFSQSLDHFDVVDSSAWQQRFWVNDTFYVPGSGHVFLYVEGEGAGR